MLIPEDGDSSSEEDQETVDFCNEQYTRDDVDSEAPQQAPEETPEEIPEQSGAPADDRIDIPLTEEEITILTSGEEEVELNRRRKRTSPEINLDQLKLSPLT